MTPSGSFPPKTLPRPLAPTLATRVQQLRGFYGMTQERLAEQANLPVQTIADIEGGIELFLAPAIRQKLARVLRVRPTTLKAVERTPPKPKPMLSAEGRERLVEEMVHFPNAQYDCLLCGASLIVRLFQRRDLDDSPLLEVKAYCSKCLFKL